MAKTPLMTQYFKIKSQHPDTILLFRVGDFFETFDEDAKLASKVLGITLTKRSNGAASKTPLAGFPHHAIDNYLPKLVKNGYRVAVCEQVEDPKTAKGIVKRDVVEIVTPGVALNEKLLDHKRNNYLAAIFKLNDNIGISFCDISTGEFFTYESKLRDLRDQILQINPSEILISKSQKDELIPIIDSLNAKIAITKIEEWIFNFDFAKDLLLEQFKTKSLKSFGIDFLNSGIVSAGAVLNYLKETQKNILSHLNKISLYNSNDYMLLDISTKRNLEITYSMNDGGIEGSLISILDKTETAMGGRLLKKWVSAPLVKLPAILKRQEAIAELKKNEVLRNNIQNELKEIGDLERLISRVATKRANARELVYIKTSLRKIPLLKQLLDICKGNELQTLNENLLELNHVIDKIERAISDNPPISLSDGNVIRSGYSPELDELRSLSHSAKDWISNHQKLERERTQIPSLKINFNRVFGYYIEISNTHKDKIPDNYIRKQTLVNSERYITPELKEYEEKILHAEEKISDLEYNLFEEVRNYVSAETVKIQNNARKISILDCYQSLAEVAEQNNYTQPIVNESDIINIEKGRHPVVEKILPIDEKFTSNDCKLDNSENQIIVLTGPNMAGKSVYLRQVGLIVLLAQIGSFVPAKKAEIGLISRIYTRVGASDNIISGESTFLVEMMEAANILNNADSKSLILMDEIGRGTSTFDGLSIAWAITEYLHENKDVSAKTLFATHYHELNEMASIFPKIKNFKVEVKEYGDKVIFMHKVSPGGADHSYGIQVAMMAGLPSFVTKRAKEILDNLENKELTPSDIKKQRIEKIKENDFQINMFEIKDDEIRDEINNLSVDKMTPLQALNKLNELKEKVNKK